MVEFADDEKSETQRRGEQLFWVATIETVTYLGLFYFWQIADSDVGTKLMGWFHGWVVMAFAVMVFWITPGIRWRWWIPVVALLLGPIGAAWIAVKLHNTDWAELEARRRSERAAQRNASLSTPSR